MFTEKAVIIGIIAVNLRSWCDPAERHREHRPARRGGGLQPGRAAGHVPPRAVAARPAGSLAGTILTFILAMNAYATPFLLGGPLFKMMAPLVYNQFTQQANGVRRRHRLHTW